MLGYNADEDHIEAAPEVAWATGDEPWSFRGRIGARGSENVAVPGASVEDFLDQASRLEHATLVLVMLSDPALCGPPSTPPASDTLEFERLLREGTRALLDRGMTPMLVTPPDIVSLAQAARAKPPTNDFFLFYASGQECGNEPGIAERQDAMNAIIGRVAGEEGALHDHGAVSAIRWEPDMVSDMDGLHPSLLGLETIAAAVWGAYDAISQGRAPITP